LLSLPLHAAIVMASIAAPITDANFLLPTIPPPSGVGPAILPDLTPSGALHNVRPCLSSSNVWPGLRPSRA
jgi:hypothetical protein